MNRICRTARWLKIADAALQLCGLLVAAGAGLRLLACILPVQIISGLFWMSRHGLPACAQRRLLQRSFLITQLILLPVQQCTAAGPALVTMVVAAGYWALTLFEVKYYYRRSLPAYH